MKDNKLTIIGKIDLTQFDRKPNKYNESEDNLSLSSEESSSIMTKNQEVEEAYRNYYRPLEDEWKKYSEQCERAREREMEDRAELDRIEQENKIELMYEKYEEELLEKLLKEEEERETMWRN